MGRLAGCRKYYSCFSVFWYCCLSHTTKGGGAVDNVAEAPALISIDSGTSDHGIFKLQSKCVTRAKIMLQMDKEKAPDDPTLFLLV